MSDQNGPSAAQLKRQAAEETLRTRTAQLPPASDGQPVEALVHELQVHQIELEMQNEELRRLQVDLDASRARYFDLYDLAPVGYLTLNELGLVQRANLMGATLLGSTRAALVHQPFGRFLAHADMDGFYLLRRKALAADRTESVELRMVQFDGAEFWAHLVVRAGIEDGARVVSVVLTDITNRKKTEAALANSAERTRAIVESALDAVVTVNATGTITEWNRQAEVIFGWTRQEATGQVLSQLIIPERFRAAAERGLARAATSAVRLHKRSELTAQRKSGEEFPVEVSLSLVHVGDADLYSAFVRDLSERKQAEETKSRLEAQLQQAQKMESVGRLAGGVAHDFNNMLTVILGNAEAALEKAGPSSPLHADLMEVREAAQRSADLTRQLLAFARKQRIAPVEMSLNERIGGMMGMLKRLLGAGLELLLKTTDELWPVMLDPSQLDQILANLCVNARDAIKGVGTIVIETTNCVVTSEYCTRHPTAIPGEFVRMVVTDSGAGMEKATLDRIFEPFFTTKGQGTGLGLATVYGAVSQNHGFIEVASEPGRGSSFSIYIPRHRAGAVAAASEAGERKVVGGKETLLLVEDEPAIRKVTARMLEAQGYTVLAAGGPVEALRLVSGHTGELHLLLTDIIMPAMTGRDLAAQVLALRPGIKQLFMSGYTADVIDGQGAHSERFIQKPFTMAELAAKVRAALD